MGLNAAGEEGEEDPFEDLADFASARRFLPALKINKNKTPLNRGRAAIYVCMHTSVRVLVCVCMCACACACVYVCVCVLVMCVCLLVDALNVHKRERVYVCVCLLASALSEKKN